MDLPERNVTHAIFGGFEIKAWYPSPYVLDGLVRPEERNAEPLRLNGGFSPAPENSMANTPDADLTDSTDVDDSLQLSATQSALLAEPPRLPVAGPSEPQTLQQLRSGKAATGVRPAKPSRQRRTESPALKSLEERGTPAPTLVKGKKDKLSLGTKLFVCEGCFKYMVHPASYAIHVRSCKTKHPPGRKVYQKGAHTIWEIDGEAQKLYCQNMCLFGKLFIDHKYVFFETSGFLFYVLTEARPSFDHVLGFFSKEKISYNDYNLACIVTFPPYQQRGYGTLMIEFSYELSASSSFSRRAGTPERPLSNLGLRGYLQFWTSVLVRYFRLIFYLREDPRLLDMAPAASVPVSQGKHTKKVRGFEGEIAEGARAPASAFNPIAWVTRGTDGKFVAGGRQRAKQSPIGKGQEADKTPRPSHASPDANTQSETSASAALPGTDTPMEDAASTASQEPFSMKFSLAEIANATGLREDDVAFTLVHSGLADLRNSEAVQAMCNDDAHEPESHFDMQVVISEEIVEGVAGRFRVKPIPVLSKAHCLF